MKYRRQLTFEKKRLSLLMDLEIAFQDHGVTHFFALLARWPVKARVRGEANHLNDGTLKQKKKKKIVFPNIILMVISPRIPHEAPPLNVPLPPKSATLGISPFIRHHQYSNCTRGYNERWQWPYLIWVKSYKTYDHVDALLLWLWATGGQGQWRFQKILLYSFWGEFCWRQGCSSRNRDISGVGVALRIRHLLPSLLSHSWEDPKGVSLSKWEHRGFLSLGNFLSLTPEVLGFPVRNIHYFQTWRQATVLSA